FPADGPPTWPGNGGRRFRRRYGGFRLLHGCYGPICGGVSPKRPRTKDDFIMGYRVAVVGATGNVGREILAILEELNFPVEKMHAIASRKSKGVEVSFGDRTIKCEDIEQFDFSSVDLVLMSAGGAVSREWSEKIGKAGPIAIHNSSAFRMDPDVPLIVPEVNPDAAKLATRK